MACDPHPTAEVYVSADTCGAAGQWIELSERISICARQLRSLIAQYCQGIDLSEAQLSLLWACLVAPPGGLSQKDLANHLVVSPAHVSGLVEQLRCQGLLCGRRNVHDRRRQHWQLAPAGQAKLQRFRSHLAGWAATIESQFVPADLGILITRLSAILSDRCAAGDPNSESLDSGVLAEHPTSQRGAA